MVYRADQDSDEVIELFSVPIDGSAPPTKLNPVLAVGGDVVSLGFGPDGTRVAYVADQDQDERFELYSVPSDGSAPAVKLNGPFVTGGDVDVNYAPSSPGGFAFSSDGSRIVTFSTSPSAIDHTSSAGSPGSRGRTSRSSTPGR